MQNPGLKYLASPPPMKTPYTLNQGGYGVPPEPATSTQDVTVGPPLSGGSSPDPVSADNGDEGDHDVFGLETSYPDKATGLPNTYLAGEGTGETQVPGDVRQHANLPDIGQEDAAEQRRIDHQKQVGGGAWENPAYEEAQDQIRARMQERREAATSDEYHGPFDMAGFEQDVNWPDPLVDTHGPGIHSVDPRSPQYDTDYERGWQASQEYDGDENSPTYRAPLEEMDDSNASHAAYDGYFDYAAGRPKWAHRAWRRLGEPGQGPDDGLPDEHWAAPHKVASTEHESTHGPKEKADMRSVLDVQGSPGNWDYDPYMHGMFNGMELMRSIADGDEPEFRDAPTQYREERAKVARTHPLFTTVNEHIPVWPVEPSVERMTALAMLKKQGETDEEFWARMEREHPGQQNQSPYMQSPDAAGQSFEEYEPSHTDHPDDWSDTDWDDMIPERMSLREHAHMLRSPGFQWDGDFRYPKYQKIVHREIVDSDGHRGHGMEGHVIEHNTHNRGPVLPEEDYEPGPLEYPWTHTYYPAGLRDEEGLVKGYNTAQQATDASHQLALWGARHPKSQELLHSGYRYVGSEMPYDPSEKLPHEIAQETRG